MLDFNYNNKEVKVERGDLLISEPFLPDPNFSRTVVLMCEHGEAGSFGFVLNKPSLIKGCDVLEDAESFDATLYVGGPVQQDTLHFIHRKTELIEGGEEISKGLQWGGNFEQLMQHVKSGVLDFDDFKFFIGYSGWEEGQLDEELQQNTWIVYKGATPEDIFDTDPDVLWKEILQKMGGKYKVISNYPTDPRLN
jgi:putative transcriptional regulator